MQLISKLLRLGPLIAACVRREGDVVFGSEDARLAIAAMVKMGLALIRLQMNELLLVCNVVLAAIDSSDRTIVKAIKKVCLIDYNHIFAICVR